MTADFERLMQQRVAPSVFDYVSTGADGEVTLKRNTQALDRLQLRPMTSTSDLDVDLSTTVLGQALNVPFLVGPTSGQGSIHTDGSLVVHRAATSAGVAHVLSHFGSRPDRVAAAAKGTLWVQLYLDRELKVATDRLKQALSAGCRAVVVTVDSPYGANEIRLRRQALRRMAKNGKAPTLASLEGPQVRFASCTWRTIEVFRKLVPVPLVLKGIQTGEDARLASLHGADGIVVSNHGGRVLDFSRPTIDSLPEVVASADKNLAVFVDSGFRTGDHILKALAVGAHAVMIGRPVLWGLGAFGEAGVRRVLDILRQELVRAMASRGIGSVNAVTKELVAGTARR